MIGPTIPAGRLKSALCLLGFIMPLSLAASANPPADPPPAEVTTVSPIDYQARLRALDEVIASCQAAMTNCQSSRVGPDLQIAVPGDTRQVHFAWLRSLLDQAAAGRETDEPESQTTEKKVKEQAASPDKNKKAVQSAESRDYIPPTLKQRLEDAHKRLADEEHEVEREGEEKAPRQSPSNQHTTLAAILAARDYHPAVAGRSIKQRVLEKIGNGINRFIASLIRAGARSKWIGITAEIAFVVLICVALVWFLIRLERQGRFTPESLGPGAGAASARDWQLWLEDAHAAASRSAWRDAIHLLYWASISRLESSGLWPADRARTPREYLALIARENPHYAGLSALTRSFERTWYAARPASEADFHQAEQLASRLTEKSGAQSRNKRGDNSSGHRAVSR